MKLQAILSDFATECNISCSVNFLEELIYKYLYHLLNTNVSAYSQMLRPTAINVPIAISVDDFTSEECEIVNSFLGWQNQEKNKLVVNLIGLAIEFAFISNDIDIRQYCKSLTNKNFYLDTNLIFRALGINGESRQKRINVFFEKCSSSGQKLFISRFTKEEFFSSIEAKISHLLKFPFDESNPFIFHKYVGSGFFEFYHNWRRDKLSNGIPVFRLYLKKLYDDFCKKYNIHEDYTIPFDIEQKTTKEIIGRYAFEIQECKKRVNIYPATTDACNTLLLETKRAGNSHNIIDTKYYLITADQGLKSWDDIHSRSQPLMLLPSQWLGLVFKYAGRATEDDFQCFMSFLSLQTEQQSTVDADRLQLIVAGISEITTDFQTQEALVDELIQSHPNILREQDTVAYQEARDYSLKKLVTEYKKTSSEHDNKMTLATIEYEQAKHKHNIVRIGEIRKVIDSIEKRKLKADKKATTTRIIRVSIAVSVAIIILSAIAIMHCKKLLEMDNPWLAFYTILAIGGIEYIISAIIGRSFKFSEQFQIYSKEYILTKIYEEYDFNLAELEDLRATQSILTTEISQFENSQMIPYDGK